MKRIFTKALFLLAYGWAWLGDRPHAIKYQLAVWRYGGKDNLPDHVKDAFVKHHVSKMDFSPETARSMEFLGNMGMLLNVYNLKANEVELAWAIGRMMMHGELPNTTTAKLIDEIYTAEFPMQRLQTAFVETGALTLTQINFRASNNKDTLEPILNWKP